LNVIKIFPESALKFYCFETFKDLLVKNQSLPDQNSLGIGQRFIAGGISGVLS
jgi:hypothetical protein